VQRTIISRLHRVYTIQQCKLALSPFDDKRYLVPHSKVETLPWGHYRCSNPENVVDLVDIDGNPVNDTDAPIVNGESTFVA